MRRLFSLDDRPTHLAVERAEMDNDCCVICFKPLYKVIRVNNNVKTTTVHDLITVCEEHYNHFELASTDLNRGRKRLKM